MPVHGHNSLISRPIMGDADLAPVETGDHTLVTNRVITPHSLWSEERVIMCDEIAVGYTLPRSFISYQDGRCDENRDPR